MYNITHKVVELPYLPIDDGGNAGESGPSLIQLEAHAGIRGITLAQLNIASDGFVLKTRERPRS